MGIAVHFAERLFGEKVGAFFQPLNSAAGMKASSFREYRIYVKKDQKYEACELIEKYKREKIIKHTQVTK